jgi:hypothetical protein
VTLLLLAMTIFLAVVAVIAYLEIRLSLEHQETVRIKACLAAGGTVFVDGQGCRL